METVLKPLGDVKTFILLYLRGTPDTFQYAITGGPASHTLIHRDTFPAGWSKVASWLGTLKYPLIPKHTDIYVRPGQPFDVVQKFCGDDFRTVRSLDRPASAAFRDFFDEINLQPPQAKDWSYMFLASPPSKRHSPAITARRTVGHRFKLWFIPGKMIDSLNKRGVTLQHRELYRIFGTFARSKDPSDHPPRHLAPEEARAIAKLPDRLRPYWYEDIGIDQLTTYYQLRIQDMLYWKYGEYARSIENWGTSYRTVKRMLAFLREVGAIVSVWPGRPAHGDWLTELERKARLKKHDRITEHWVTRWMVAMNETQMRHFKWINAELKRRGLPPYLIYLR